MKLVKNLILEIVDFLEKNLETKSEIKILKSIKDNLRVFKSTE